MKVQVIIPTYAGSNVISRALFSLTQQTMHDFMVTIVDDNGRDTVEQKSTQKVVNKFMGFLNIKYLIHEKNSNGAVARNTGLKICEADYIAFLDDDDFFLPNHLIKSVNYLDNNLSDDVVFSSVIIAYDGKPSRVITPIKVDNIEKYILKSGTVFGTGSNIFIRRSVYKNIGGFNESYGRHQDLEYMLRVLKKHCYGIIEEIGLVKVSNILNVNGKLKYQRTIDILDKYYEDFKDVLESLTYEERQEVYIHEAQWLLGQALSQGEYGDAIKAKKYLSRYRKLTVKENIYMSLKSIKIGASDAFICLMQQVRRKRSKQEDSTVSLISKEHLKEFDRIMNYRMQTDE